MKQDKTNIIIQHHKKTDKIFILDRLEKKIFIGNIEGDTFRFYDDANYHHMSKSLGVDYKVLISPLLRYRWLHFVYEGINYRTTRSYFYHHMLKLPQSSRRDMKFLPLDKFGVDKALRWEEYMDNLATAQLDLFKVFDEQRLTGEDNNEFLRQWEKSNTIVQDYNQSQKYKNLIL